MFLFFSTAMLWHEGTFIYHRAVFIDLLPSVRGVTSASLPWPTLRRGKPYKYESDEKPLKCVQGNSGIYFLLLLFAQRGKTGFNTLVYSGLFWPEREK